jgi:regulator of replication initiation timing
MSDDIVERLRYPLVRDPISIHVQYADCRDVMKEAADVIEQMREKSGQIEELLNKALSDTAVVAENFERLRSENNRLRQALGQEMARGV